MESRNPLSRMIEELEQRKMFVSNIPATPAGGASTDTCKINRNPEWKVKKRALMAEKGLYRRHSTDHPLLRDFAIYLSKDLNNENYKQEVENVARVLFYMDPAQPSLQFVRDREKTKEYIRQLSEAQLTKQTQVNYLKSLKRFLHYHTVSTNLLFNDPDLHSHAKHYMEFIGALQTQLSKGVSKEVVAKRERIIRGDMKTTPHDCWAVLRAAKTDFLAVMGKIFESASTSHVQLETLERLLVLYYLEAIVVLRHLQRPGVVEHMTVEEWKNRTQVGGGHVSIAVKEHKMARQQVASFVLSPEEETWFISYFDVVRDQLRTSKRAKYNAAANKVAENPQDRYFLSSSGMPVYNCSNDIARLHQKYKVPLVTSQVARRVFETAAKALTDVDKSLVADYLTHSTATAEKHYRMKRGASLLRGSEIIRLLGAELGGDSGKDAANTSEMASNPVTAPVTANVQTDFQAVWDKFAEKHPVTLDGVVPSLLERRAASEEHKRKLYERWLKYQMKLRLRHVISHFRRRLPSDSRVAAWIASRGWKSNMPRVASVLEGWKPSSSL
ncbi:uncharacterized protein LOC125884641 [Epinephelus fuscoguttatus]|uniref:uncharacterized protein LOC125884641 n=1 Tax=Epinephelus fuscoguttatus TaxID=293821 RepID=UPI0020D1AECA|nr:uncharacterized protein LOC125884641 [Epinephelus fuscoguttatus]